MNLQSANSLSPSAVVVLAISGLLLLLWIAAAARAWANLSRRAQRAWDNVSALLDQRAARVSQAAMQLTVPNQFAAAKAAIQEIQQRLADAETTRAERIAADQEVSRLLVIVLAAAPPPSQKTEAANDMESETLLRERVFAEARERYNEAAQMANTFRHSFPGGFIARALTSDALPLFAGADEESHQ